MINISKQFLISGVQDNNIKKRIISPFIINIPKRGDKLSQINFNEYGDLLKIKGFIIKKKDLYSLNDKNINIHFGSSSNYIIPFSFLLSMNTINYDNDTYFIDFPHDYLLNHYIPLKQYSIFTLEIINIKDLDVKLVIESTFLDSDERKLFRENKALYNFRYIKKFELYLIGSGDQPNNINIYESKINPKFLCQGIIIDCSKKFIDKFTVICDFRDEQIIIKDYNKFLIELYGIEIGKNHEDSNEKKLTYFGFNLEEDFKSNNLVGCVNMSKLDNVKIIINLLENENYCDKTTDLIIYLITWNEIKYVDGLCGFTYC
jgi:hypothetical protein